jgi:hypothetical protein
MNLQNVPWGTIGICFLIFGLAITCGVLFAEYIGQQPNDAVSGATAAGLSTEPAPDVRNPATVKPINVLENLLNSPISQSTNLNISAHTGWILHRVYATSIANQRSYVLAHFTKEDGSSSIALWRRGLNLSDWYMLNEKFALADNSHTGINISANKILHYTNTSVELLDISYTGGSPPTDADFDAPGTGNILTVPGSGDITQAIFDNSSADHLYVLRNGTLYMFDGTVWSNLETSVIAFHQNGNSLAVDTSDSGIVIYSRVDVNNAWVDTNRTIVDYKDDETVNWIRITSDGSFIVFSASENDDVENNQYYVRTLEWFLEWKLRRQNIITHTQPGFIPINRKQAILCSKKNVNFVQIPSNTEQIIDSIDVYGHNTTGVTAVIDQSDNEDHPHHVFFVHTVGKEVSSGVIVAQLASYTKSTRTWKINRR